MNINKFNIGISAAEPTDMHLWGISSTHIKDAMMELARYSISNGYSVSYGGDLQYKDFVNFPELLKEIVIRYAADTKEIASRKSVTNYLSWYISLKTSKDVKKSFSQFMNLVETPPPNEIDSPKLSTAKNIKPIQKARSLSKMREVMNRDIDARVLLAGKITGSSGVYPGLIEEAYLALKDKKPVYLLGGFGGCTYKIVELIEKKKPNEITLEYQVKKDNQKKDLINEYNLIASSHPEYNFPAIDYKKMVKFFENVGIKGLNNGLSIEENKILFETRNIKEMLRLLFKGLSIVSKKQLLVRSR